VEVTPTDSVDAPQFAGLVEKTARRFPIREVSADNGYLSLENLHTVAGIGAMVYIPLKQCTTGVRPDMLWNRMWRYYMFQRKTFLQDYHKLSNVETTFSMIKAKFGHVIRAKLPVVPVDEVLHKALSDNLCARI
jgi:transposase